MRQNEVNPRHYSQCCFTSQCYHPSGLFVVFLISLGLHLFVCQYLSRLLPAFYLKIDHLLLCSSFVSIFTSYIVITFCGGILLESGILGFVIAPPKNAIHY
ncbi:hypothetical protein BDV23DRAFT_133294 [Aspergillus alliaceus]|uniref:Uncharacterized protein n=1 Tax=Petromyces alliaceus TaxID=209559 RepID=A0A5N7BYJ9_PETAA|nr:hypothetical protein BDV23DRAFT_133294 [Aspergillus alliaceus]